MWRRERVAGARERLDVKQTTAGVAEHGSRRARERRAAARARESRDGRRAQTGCDLRVSTACASAAPAALRLGLRRRRRCRARCAYRGLYFAFFHFRLCTVYTQHRDVISPCQCHAALVTLSPPTTYPVSYLSLITVACRQSGHASRGLAPGSPAPQDHKPRMCAWHTRAQVRTARGHGRTHACVCVFSDLTPTPCRIRTWRCPLATPPAHTQG